MTLVVIDANNRRHSIALGSDPGAVFELHIKEHAKAKPRGKPNVEEAVKIEIQAANVYECYPRKVGRPAALKKIAKAIKGSGYDFVLQRCKLFAAAWADCPDNEKQFIPHPSTWFNQERYNDDPETWKRATQGKPSAAQRDRNAALSGEARSKSQQLAKFARRTVREDGQGSQQFQLL